MQYYHQRDVKHRLKEQEELRHRSGPEAPHSHHLAAEAARQNGLGQVDVEEGQRVRQSCVRSWSVCGSQTAAGMHTNHMRPFVQSPRWHLSGGWTNKVVASMHREEPEEELGGERS